MYILKNSLISIIRNKGRNILIGLIILTIACASTVTLAIRNTANTIVKSYEESYDLIATISFDRGQLGKNFKGGEDAQKENIEAFNDIQSVTIDDVKNYGESSYLKGYYYTYTTSLNSDTLSKATDSFEYEVEDKQTSTSSNTTTSTTGGSGSRPDMPEGQMGERHTVTENNTTIVITKSKEKFESDKNLTGDFELDGYSSYDAMTEFTEGTSTITDGEMISDFNGCECVISSELATLNSVNVGDTITLKNSTIEKTYDFNVTGIYSSNNDNGDTASMYSKSANKIITGSGVIEQLVADDSTLTTNVTPSFILNSEDDIEAFTAEVTEKGLNEYYTVNTNLEEITSATELIENVKTFATTFLIITLIISSLVLFVINMINIRERKYEIGVFRTIGMSKLKLTMQFVLELLIIQLLGIGLLLTLISSLASMISIQRFSPLTILKERL